MCPHRYKTQAIAQIVYFGTTLGEKRGPPGFRLGSSNQMWPYKIVKDIYSRLTKYL